MKRILLVLSLMIGTAAAAATESVPQPPEKPKEPSINTNPMMKYSNPKTIQITSPCDHYMVVFEIMKNNRESLLFTANGFIQESTTGKSYPGGLYIWANIDTGTVTLSIMFADGNMCLLAPGNTFTPYSGQQPWDKEKKQSF